MAMPGFLRKVRDKIGNDLLVLPSAAAAILDGQNRLVVIKDASVDQWSIPGGIVDPFESPAAAAVREVEEETGLIVEPFALMGVYGGREHFITYPNGHQVCYVCSVFRCRITGGELKADQDEITDAAFRTKEEVERLELRDWVRRILPHIWSPRGGCYF